MQNNFGPYDAESQNIEQRRKYAEALRGQALEPIQQQTAGGYVVPIHPLQGLAKMLQAYGSRRGMEMADEQRKDLMGRMDTERSTDMAKLLQTYGGTPARPQEMGADDQAMLADQGGQANPMTQAVPGDLHKALQVAASSRSPQVQAFIPELFKMTQKEAPKWIEAKIPDGKGGTRVGFVNTNSTNPLSTFQEGGVQPEKLEFVNGKAVSPTQTPSGTVVPQQSNPFKDLLIPGPDGKPVTNAPLVAAQSTVRAAGKPVTTVINSAGPKAFDTELGKQDAEQLGKWREGAIAGNSTLELVENMRGAIKQGVYSGGGAEAKTYAANMISGLTGFTPKETAGSQLFNAEASKLVLDKIKTLGANPSNADREFIERTIPNIATNKEARDALINFLEKKAKDQIDLFQRADDHARKNNGLKGFNYFQKRRASDSEPPPGAVERVDNG